MSIDILFFGGGFGCLNDLFELVHQTEYWHLLLIATNLIEKLEVVFFNDLSNLFLLLYLPY